MQWFAEAGPADEAARTGDTAPDAGEQEDFAALIRGRYKADFDARVQKILDGRLRGLRQENARLRQEREQRQEQARQALEAMAAQEEQVRQVYPEFRWQREMENPAFGRLVCAGVEPMAAYEVVHREDILRRGHGLLRQADGTAGGTLHRQRGQASGRERRAVCRRDGQRSQRTDIP